MGDSEMVDLVKQMFDQLYTKVDGRLQSHGEGLREVVTKLDNLPCKYCLRKIDEHEAVLNQGKGAKWLVGVQWTVLVSVGAAAMAAIKYCWK